MMDTGPTWSIGEPEDGAPDRHAVLGDRLAQYVAADEAQNAELKARMLRYIEGDGANE